MPACHENSILLSVTAASTYTLLVYLLLLLGHQQDILPIAAAGATFFCWFLLFFRKCSFSKCLTMPIPFGLGLCCLAYLISNALLNSSDVLFSNPVLFMAQDGRIFYTLTCTLMFATIAGYDFDSRYLLMATFLAGIITASASLFLITTNLQVYVLDRPLGFSDAGVPVGFLGEKNPFAGSLGSSLLAGVLLLVHEKRKLWVLLLLIVLGIISITMSLTGSRGYFLTALLVAFLISYYEKRGSNKPWGVWIGGSAVLLAASIFFINKSWDRLSFISQGYDKNLWERFLLWQHYLGLWKESILTGLGPGSGSMPDLQVQSLIPVLLGRRISGTRFDTVFWEGGLPLGLHSHNIVVQCLLEFGLIGLFLLGFFIFYGMKSCVRSLPPHTGRFAVYLFLYLFISGMADGLTLASPSISLPFFVMLALGISKAANGKSNE
jgi:O-antigen ligase